MFEAGQEYSTREVLERFTGQIAQRTVKDALKRAVENGDLVQPRHGFYWNPNITNDLGESAESATDIR